ncbi:MAG: hypothetical protein OXG62_03355 [Nitrospinae bacterium]|nr:hypothetical protein [Nitrospinota bacterium]
MWGDKTPEGVRGSSDLRRIATVGGQMEALILKSRLEAERIPVHLSYDSAGSVYAFSRTNLGAVHLMVPEAFAEAALHIYREIRSAGEAPESSTDA